MDKPCKKHNIARERYPSGSLHCKLCDQEKKEARDAARTGNHEKLGPDASLALVNAVWARKVDPTYYLEPRIKYSTPLRDLA